MKNNDHYPIHRPSLYQFLRLINNRKMEKTILDCGAGGIIPPLELFHRYGYEVTGIEIDDEQLKKIKDFEQENNLNLNIHKGDMRNLDFADNTFSYVYSVNTIFHLTKQDTEKAMEEMKRVLKPRGIVYVNFLSVEDQGFGQGEEVNPGEFRQEEHGDKVIHTYFEDHEPDQYFNDMEILYWQKGLAQFKFNHKIYKPCFYDYIAKKIE